MSRDIKLCHPKLQVLANRLVAEGKKQGLIIKLGECFRSASEQDALYAQGRTKPGNIVTNARGSSFQSMHQWGVAFDVIRNDGKGAYNNSDGWFDRVGKIGKALGLEWGGDWTNPVDRPHFQLPDWGSTPNRLKKLYGNVNNFKKTWEVKKVIDNYNEAVKLLVQRGVVADREYWDNAIKCVKYLDRLIINMANALLRYNLKKTLKSKKVIKTYDEAVKVLVDRGVIADRKYWDIAVKCVKYLDRLFINTANALLR